LVCSDVHRSSISYQEITREKQAFPITSPNCTLVTQRRCLQCHLTRFPDLNSLHPLTNDVQPLTQQAQRTQPQTQMHQPQYAGGFLYPLPANSFGAVGATRSVGAEARWHAVPCVEGVPACSLRPEAASPAIQARQQPPQQQPPDAALPPLDSTAADVSGAAPASGASPQEGIPAACVWLQVRAYVCMWSLGEGAGKQT
jgi:hypothetical protein